jgi:hypothetical protein
MTDPQDPLPEPSFKWRRLMAFAVVAASLALVWRLTYLVPANDALGAIHAVLAFAALMLLLWAGGASAADISGILANLKLRLRGPRPADPPTVQTRADD